MHTTETTSTTASAPAPIDEQDAVEEHRHLVVRLARATARRSGPGIEVEDLVAVGLIGVLRAARSYDAALNVPFTIYAARHARWAMLTEVRNTRPIRRSANDRRQLLRRAEDRLVQQLHQTPSRQELAEELHASPAAIERWQAEVAAAEGNLHTHAVDDAATEPADLEPLPEDVVLDLELTADLHHAIDALPPRLAGVVRTTFFEGRRLSDVAEELGVTESRVSQLRTEAVHLLRTRLLAAASS